MEELNEGLAKEIAKYAKNHTYNQTVAKYKVGKSTVQRYSIQYNGFKKILRKPMINMSTSLAYLKGERELKIR